VLWFPPTQQAAGLAPKALVSALQLKHTFVIHGNTALAISLALQNKK